MHLSVRSLTRRVHQYQIVGRAAPTQKNPIPKICRMKLFAKNKVVARSRFWYFMGRLCRVKKANGQIISVSQARTRQRARPRQFCPRLRRALPRWRAEP